MFEPCKGEVGQRQNRQKYSKTWGRTGFPVLGKGEGCYGGFGSRRFSDVHGGREKAQSGAERVRAGGAGSRRGHQIGRAPCRERVWKYVKTTVVAVSLKKNNNKRTKK